jgi:DNA-binding Lrp family transcriptional regulator
MNKTYTLATYEPIRNYHTRRVRKLRGRGIIDRFKFDYEYDGEFRLQTDLGIGIGISFVAAVGIVTILILTIG